MSFRPGSRLFAVALTLLFGACTSNNTVDPADLPFLGQVRALNAMVDIETTFFFVQFEDFDPSLTAGLNYQLSTSPTDFSDREYAFSFEIELPGDTETTVLAETTGNVTEGVLYDFVLAGTFADPQFFVWEQPVRDWDRELIEAFENGGEITELEVAFGHASATLGALDIYLEAPGTDLTLATPRATLELGGLEPVVVIDADTYQITVTESGDPAAVLFSSNDIELLAATTNVFVVLDDTGLTPANLRVRRLGSTGAFFVGRVDATAEVDLVHAAPGTGAVDLFATEEGEVLDQPIISGVEFGTLAEAVVVPPGEKTFSLTPAGDTQVILAETEADENDSGNTGERVLPDDSYRRIFLAGLPGDLEEYVFEYDQRTLATHGRLRVFNGSVQFEALDVYLVEPGTDIADAFPTYFSLGFGEGTFINRTDPDEYSIVVTEATTKNIVSGPVPFTVETGDVFEVLITDADEATLADITIIQTAPAD